MTESDLKRIKPPKPGIYRAVPMEDYLRWDAVNSSALSTLADESPLHVDKGCGNDESKAKTRGTLLHAALLEPERFDKDYAIGPDVKLNVKAGKDEWKAFVDANPGKIHVRGADGAVISGMRRSVWNHPEASRLLKAPGERELSLIWTDEITGLTCKARVDKYNDDGTIVDLKKTTLGTAKLVNFTKRFYEYGYHRQAPFYIAGCYANGLAADAFNFVVVEDDGNAFASAVHEVSELALEYGMMCVRALLDLYKLCKDEKIWPGYGYDWKTKTYRKGSIGVPDWQMKKPPFE